MQLLRLDGTKFWDRLVTWKLYSFELDLET